MVDLSLPLSPSVQNSLPDLSLSRPLPPSVPRPLPLSHTQTHTQRSQPLKWSISSELRRDESTLTAEISSTSPRPTKRLRGEPEDGESGQVDPLGPGFDVFDASTCSRAIFWRHSARSLSFLPQMAFQRISSSFDLASSLVSASSACFSFRSASSIRLISRPSGTDAASATACAAKRAEGELAVTQMIRLTSLAPRLAPLINHVACSA